VKPAPHPPPRPPYPGDLLDHLRSFSILADAIERSDRAPFVQAARALAVDVSVLRRRITTLTSHVDTPLVEGRGPTLRLTRAGARVRASAARALEAAAELVAAGPEDAGPLRIACTGTILAEVLPDVLRALRDEHPRLHFRVRRAGAEAARALLMAGDVDFAVVRAGPRPEGLDSARLGVDRLWLVAPAASAIAKTKRLTPAAVAREPLIGYSSSSSTMRRVLDVLGPFGASPWIEVDGKAAALGYAAAGLGVGFVSALEPQKPSRHGVIVRDVTAWFAPTSFWLVWTAGAVARARWARRFVELVTRR
jgi:LysR family transcriptional activator of glutamate synthase operon